ncbi:hypothetical protein TRVA0_024S02256 [Trichomonascus vanleenenianus]|uniref:uncharacterized protein n=1 Tax=Trichomonascus vanleenenianus TaxID=2268995 RepID=UPI003ECA3420
MAISSKKPKFSGDKILIDNGICTNQLVRRYVFQVLRGCGNKTCRKPFCFTNPQRLFAARKVKPSAAFSLASQLVSARGISGLCTALQTTMLDYDLERDVNIVYNQWDHGERRYNVSLSLRNTRSYDSWQKNELILAVKKTIFTKLGQYKIAVKGEGLIALSVLFDIDEALRLYTTHAEIDFIRFATNICAVTSLYQSTEFPIDRYVLHVLKLHRQWCIGCGLEEGICRIDYLIGTILSTSKSNALPLPLIFDAPEQNFRVPRGEMARRMCEASAIRYLGYWPVWSPYSVAFGGAHNVLSFLEDSRSNFSLEIHSPPQAFFRRYNHSNSLSPATYIPQMPKLLPQSERYLLFRYGCLRQMGITRDRLSNIDMVMSKTEFILPESPLGEPSLASVKYFIMDIDRDNAIGSAVACLSKALQVDNMIRRPLKVRYGVGEIAADHGGVQVEFFEALGYLLINSGHGFFEESDGRMAWFNPGYTGEPKTFEYLGVLFGLALYNGCVIDTRFPDIFYKMLKTQDLSYFDISDVVDLFPQLARSLEKLLTYDGDVEELGLTFEFSYKVDGEDNVTVDKLPSYYTFNGGLVTNSNVHQYVREYLTHRLHTSVKPYIKAFINGFQFVISDQLLNILATEDLKELVEGTAEINIRDLERNTDYLDGFSKDSPTVRFFWSIVKGFNEIEKRLLLEFVTGSKRVPIGGLNRLPFAIQRNGSDSSKLPTASVCFARLLLPEYDTQQELREKLYKALEHSQGFGLV